MTEEYKKDQNQQQTVRNTQYGNTSNTTSSTNKNVKTQSVNKKGQKPSATNCTDSSCSTTKPTNKGWN